MATEAPLQGFRKRATCSVCLDYFQNPVLIPACGHNFCRSCLIRSWWTSETEASCPQCKQTFAPRSLLPNRQLAWVLEAVRKRGGPWGEEGGSFCLMHLEPLKLFCKEHETLICLVCDGSKEHEGHSVIPPEEAFPEYQIKVEDCLKAQEGQKEKIATYTRDIEQTVQERLDLIKKVEKKVADRFRELELLLQGQKKLMSARMKETEEDIMARKEKSLAELCFLEDLIQEIEEKHQQPASKLLQDIGSNLKKYQAKETYENPVDLLLEPKWTIWDYNNIPALLKGAMKKLRDTLESGLQVQKVSVILDPDTANTSRLDVSKDRKSVQGLKQVKAIYNDSKGMRSVDYSCVLGCQTFSMGRHFWEVIVGGTAGWCVGVASKPMNETNADQQTMRWEFWKCGGEYTAMSPSESCQLDLTKEPTRIRIALNCEEGRVSFLDAKTAALLHTFSDASLVGETLLPCFYLGEGTRMTLP